MIYTDGHLNSNVSKNLHFLLTLSSFLTPNYGGGNEDNGYLLQKVHACSAALSAPDPVAGHCQPTPSPQTLTLTASLDQSLWGHCFFLLGPGAHTFCLCPPRVFPQACVSSVIKSHCPPMWRRQWQPTPVLLPGKSHGRRSLVGYSPWGHEELDRTDPTSLSLFTFMHWRRKWQPTPVCLPGESQGREPGGPPSMGSTESNMTDVT